MAQSDPAVNPHDLITPAVITTIWATSFGIVMSALPVLVIWTLGASGAGSLAAAVKAAFLAWPISHGVPVKITSVTIDILPLLAVLFPILILRRAAIRMFRITPPQWRYLVAIGLPIVLVNSLLSFALAWLASDDVIGVSPVLTFLIVLLVSLIAVLFGGIKVYGLPKIDLPLNIKFGVRVGLFTTLLLLVSGFILVLIMFGINFAAALDVVASIADTNSEKFLVWLFTLGYLPIAITWGYAWLLGPGVATGVDSAASFAVIDQSALPALPWLAALPTTSASNGWYLLLIPILISSLLAILMWWSLHNESYRTIFTNSLMAITIVLTFSVLFSVVGGGAIGPGRLSVFGPQWLPMIGGVFATIAPVFVLLLLLESIRRWFNRRSIRNQNA